MLRAVALGDGAGVGALVVAVVAEADRERPHRLDDARGHLGDDDARVDAAREQRAERHVGDEPPPDGRADRLADELEPVARRGARPAAAPATSTARPRTDAALGDEQVAGRQLLDARAGPCPPGTYWSARYASSAAGSSSRETPGSRSSAFSSEANASVPSGSRVQSSGFLPTRSRASTSRSRPASQSAIANIPRARATNAGP